MIPDHTAHFKVVFPDPWSSSRGYSKEDCDSTHTTQESAEARCKEIIITELARRRDEGISWTEALHDYLHDRRLPRLEPRIRGKKMYMDEFAAEWVAQKLAEDWPALIAKIEATPPETPRSWFRWLHHRWLSRTQPQVNIKLTSEWKAVEQVVITDSLMLDAPLIAQIESHAWEIGRLGLQELANHCWIHLSPHARGRLLAGLSDLLEFFDLGMAPIDLMKTSDPKLADEIEALEEWLLRRLPESTLTAESTLELACNAVLDCSERLLVAVLGQGASWLTQSVERMEPLEANRWSRESSWSQQISGLSHRVIDMVLEASVFRGWIPGARFALMHGADSNLRLWALERSYNEKFTVLSHAISEKKPELAMLLIESGASPAAEASSKALHFAIAQEDDTMADRLLAAGFGFSHGEPIEDLQRLKTGKDWNLVYLNNCNEADVERAHKLAESLPLVSAREVAWFYDGDAQGGRWRTTLALFLFKDDSQRLQIYAAKGLPLKATFFDLAIALKYRAVECLAWLMQHWGTAEVVRHKVLQCLA